MDDDVAQVVARHRRQDRWVRFGGVMMSVIGTFGIIEGIMALGYRFYFWTDAYGNVLAVNLTGWGFLHIILGLLVVGTGLSLLGARVPRWARTVGVAFVVLNLLVQLAWLPAAPLWSIIMIVLDVFVLLALISPWRERRGV